MAVAHQSLPEGRWKKDKHITHWLRFKRFHVFDDSSANEFIELQKQLREAMSTAQETLEEHKIPIGDIYSESFLDHRVMDRVYAVAIGFECVEDYAMAKLVLKCDEFI
jgi:hypothetical protein